MSRHFDRSLLLGVFCVFILLFDVPAAKAQGVHDTNQTDATAESDRVVVYPNTDDETPAPEGETPAESAEVLQRRAGERLGPDTDTESRAAILGMYVQEADSGHLKVVDVVAATPAFDAGIRKDDIIISFDGFKADSYRQWIDGIRRLVNNAEQNSTMPIQLTRDDKTLNLRIRKPEARAGEFNLSTQAPLDQQQSIQQDQSTQQPLFPPPAQPGRGYGGGGDLLVANFFGGQFGDRLGGSTQRAVAEIFRVATQQMQHDFISDGQLELRGEEPTGQGRTQGGVQPTGMSGQRIGLAGFRNAEAGMLVMLDVGGLEPGRYQVGIGDPGMIGGPGESALNPELNDQTPQPNRRQQQIDLPNQQRDNPPQVQPLNQQPGAPQPTIRRGQPAGNQPQGLNRPDFVPRTVLAQVAEGTASDTALDTPATGQVEPLDTPPTGASRPLDTPATGQVEPLDTPATGLPPDPRDALSTEQQANPRATGQQNLPGTQAIDPGVGSTFPGGPGLANGINRGGFGTGGPGAGPAIPVGTLIVDESGTGRLQQVVEGVSVENVVGQSIVIYSQGGVPRQSLPPNLDPGAVPLTPQGTAPSAVDPNRAALRPQERTRQNNPAQEKNPQQTNLQLGNQPVAAGIVRLLSDPSDTSSPNQNNQPAANLPSTPQELR